MIDQSFQLLACKYLKAQLEKLQKELSGAKTAGDIESVHQSRVATRRMRAGLNFFNNCFPAKKTKKWLNQIRKMTKKLSAARDRDVQIKFVREFLSNLDKSQKQYKPGINRLLLRLEQSREKVQPKVVKSVDAFNSTGILADMHGEIEKILFRFRDKIVPLQSHFVFQQSNECIKKQLNVLISHQDCLSNPSDVDGIHQMRISAKKLRYTLEICDAAFEGELKEIIKKVKKIQTLLGDIHDCDVWRDYLERFVIGEEQRIIEFFGHTRYITSIRNGLEYLNSECTRRRDVLFGEFVEYCDTINEESLWGRLLSITNTRLEEYQKTSEVNLTD